MIKRITFLLGVAFCSAAWLSACGGDNNPSPVSGTPVSTMPVAKHKVIIFVWDGMRPDSINAVDTPHLLALRDSRGVNFTDNHSTYPTFTMMNAASFATGSFPGTTGFYGNTLYQSNPGCASPLDANGLPLKTCATGSYGQSISAGTNSFVQPVFTEDYAILDDLEAFYQTQSKALLNVGTLFQAAQAAGLKTAAVGKTGPAYLQDYLRGGVLLDESVALPASLATGLQAAGYPLPARTPLSPYYYTYAGPTAGTSTITLAANNGDPTAAQSTTRLADGVTADPRSTAGSLHNAANQYMMRVYVDYILPTVNPDLSLVWFRTPDSTEHTYGPGSPNYHNGLQSQDALLGLLLDKLDVLGIAATTDVIVANDHGHSLVAGDSTYFPLRALTGDAGGGSGAFDLTTLDSTGYPVSGDVRTADILAKQGVLDVYDGSGCLYDPVHSGIKADGTNVYPTQTEVSPAAHGCTPGSKFSTASYLVPATLPADATVIAANGGSDYLYLPDGNATRLQRIVTILQSRKEYGAIFVKSKFCPANVCPAGTLPMTLVRLESTSTSTPDLVVSFNFDETFRSAINPDVPGREYESMQGNWGMHGSFSPIDVHNTLVAVGPDFKVGYVDALPSGNVDVAPTVASILGLSLPNADGRVLHEALSGDTTAAPTVAAAAVTPATPATALVIQNPTDPTGASVDASVSQYTFTVSEKVLTDAAGKSFTYFDQAKPTRQ